LGGAVTAIIGTIKQAIDAGRYFPGSGLGTFAVFVGYTAFMVGAPLKLVNNSNRFEFIKDLNSTINDSRICRLQYKIRTIEKRLTTTISETSKEQCLLAKDFFHLKEVEMICHKTNQITVR
jgi:hypothetical protein